MRAWLNLRYTNDRRAILFEKGLRKLGYTVVHGMTDDPGSRDVFITWNRIGRADSIARVFEKLSLTVLVVENATWGNSFAGDDWYHIARKYHNTEKCFPVGSSDRWDELGVNLGSWRTKGETLILPQRGIGSDPVRMPKTFPKMATREHGGRVRKHPGIRVRKSLEDDLESCGKVITWGSGAAVKALIMGIPVVSYYPKWIAKQDNTDDSRIDMFRLLAWAQWRHEEIASGLAFEHLIHR